MRLTWALRAEGHARAAARLAEVLGVADPAWERTARAMFAMASRIRSDRTGVRP